MKHLTILLLLLGLTLSSFSQTKVIKYYDNGKVRLEGFVSNDTYDSTYITYYQNGNKMEEGSYNNSEIYKANQMTIFQSVCGVGRDTTEPREGKRNGLWKFYYENGKLKCSDNYFGDIKVGMSTFFDSTGNLIVNEFYNAGQLIQRQEYFSNGLLEKFINRTHKREKDYQVYYDKVFEYYSTGELKSIIIFNIDEDTTGEFIEYWKNGFVKYQGKYNKGEYDDAEKNGSFREYYENGNLKFFGVYKNDIPDGKHYYCNSEGENIRIEKTWRRGKLIKTEKIGS